MMITGAYFFVVAGSHAGAAASVPSSTMLGLDLKGAKPACIPCPGGVYCYPNCPPPPPPPPPCNPASITWHGVQLASPSYRVAWVNWTASSGTTSVSFKWGYNSNYNPSLPTPQSTGSPTSGSYELNNVGAGSTYYYQLTPTSSCGGKATQDQFTTGGAPTGQYGGYSGWVYSGLTQPNSHVVMQEGALISGAWVNFTAWCWSTATAAQSGDPSQEIVFNIGWGGYSLTNSAGWYQALFPIDTNYTGMDRYNTIVYYSLNSGNCETFEVQQGTAYYGYFYQSNFTATVTAQSGVWSSTRSVTSSPNAVSGYQPYVLTPNTLAAAFVPVTLALVHSSAIQCENTWTTGSSQTINQYIGGNGHQYTWANTSQIGPQWPGWGTPSGIELKYTSTGTMNEAAHTPTNAWAIAYDGSAATPYRTSDWLNDATFNYGTPGGNYLVQEVPTNFQQSNPYPLSWTQTATYSSTSGTEFSADVSVCVVVDTAGVGYGACFGTSVTLTDTTTDVYTTQATMTCEMYDPSTTQTAVFYYTFGGGATAFQPVIHVWLAGYCPTGQETC